MAWFISDEKVEDFLDRISEDVIITEILGDLSKEEIQELVNDEESTGMLDSSDKNGGGESAVEEESA